MRSKKGFIQIATIITVIIFIAIVVVLFNIFRQNNFNGFTKAVTDPVADTQLKRDSNVKYSEHDSYRITSNDYNDAVFFKEIEVEPNTPYRISCMLKTENVETENTKDDAGAMICIMDTYDYSIPLTGTNDWQKIELIFDSNINEKVRIAFRLGGNENGCKGTAWFSDYKLEKAEPNTSSEWNVGCFILKNIDVSIGGSSRKFITNSNDIKNIYSNMERYRNTVATMSRNQMSVIYRIHEIETPLTSISYDEEHGYYISPSDTKDLIYDLVQEYEYDHIFVVARMEDPNGEYAIPIKGNWIGLRSNGYVWNRILNNKNKQRRKQHAI